MKLLYWFAGLLLGVVLGSMIPQDKYSGTTQAQFDELAARFMQLAQITKGDEEIIKQYEKRMGKH